MAESYDFSGWATRNNLRCSDDRVIMKDAFKDQDGETVPLVWNHNHTDMDRVLGHALLQNRDEGVYAYCKFNLDTPQGKLGKQLVDNGDIRSLSIFANKLQQAKNYVTHGVIRELSLVHAGANPGAYIDFIMAHGDEEGEGLEGTWDESIVLNVNNEEIEHSATEKKEEVKMENKDNKTVEDVINSMSEEQKNVFYAIVGNLLESQENANKEGDNNMKHNVFDNEGNSIDETTLQHDAMAASLADAKRYGSLKDSFMAHAADYGIDQIDYLMPEYKSSTGNTPEFIKREMGWVSVVMNGVHHVPFARIKSVFADITEDQARAKGYIKGKYKKEEVFSLLKRQTSPTTIYKKQKLDRDDIIDIADLDVVAWLKAEMRMMLDEEIARAILIGDGRLASDDDHIDETCIRPIWKDADLFTIKVDVQQAASASDEDKAKANIKAIIKSRKNYKGSGNPTLFTTEDFVTDCLLIEDATGRRIYKTETDLAVALRVKNIVTVEVMEQQSREVGGVTKNLVGIIVNLNDYHVGADKGGSINMFEDFDIDFNQQKYLIETRCSGALVKPFSAIAIENSSAS